MSKKTVSLALYGCGNRTKALLDSIKGEDEYRIRAAFDIRPEAVDALVKQYGGKPCSSEEELLDCAGVDAFLISLDPFAHGAAFDKTLERGKPIFIEKPIALSAKRAHGMMKAAREKSVPVHVGFIHRYYGMHEAAKKYMAENPPGVLFSVKCDWFHAGETEMVNCMNNFPDNFRLKLSQIPFHCCHALDVLMLYGGNIKRVDARGIKVIERNYPSPDEVIALLEFENGAIGYFHYSSMAYSFCGGNYLIHTANYTLDISGGFMRVYVRPPTKYMRGEFDKDCRDKYHANIGPTEQAFPGTLVDNRVMNDFLTMVREGRSDESTMDAAYKVAELAEAIELSWKEKRIIDLPMKFD